MELKDDFKNTMIKEVTWILHAIAKEDWSWLKLQFRCMTNEIEKHEERVEKSLKTHGES